MKIIVFEDGKERGLGIVSGDEVQVIARGEETETVFAELISSTTEDALALTEKNAKGCLRLEDVTLLPPVISRLAPILCVGKNYTEHAKEFFGSGFDSTARDEIPSHPVVFAKSGSSLIADRGEINSKLDPTGTVDYEGELAVVIGRSAHKVSKGNALKHVFGYTVCNDVTSRELQKKHNQWLIGKSLDTFCPLGPAIVSADEIGDITAQTLTTTVNGEVRQKTKIENLIFGIETLIETLSATMTLPAGTIIATGTPAGVGIGFSPPRYLKSGDEVTVEITGIGKLTNTVK